MEFLNRIRPILCHDPEYMQVVTTPDAGPALQCQSCGQLLPVYACVDRVAEQDMDEACRLAEMYRAWTGDDGIPVRFPLMGIDGLFSKVIEHQTLGRIATSVQLLKWLNAPFTQDAVVTSLDSIPIPWKSIFEDCLAKCNAVASSHDGTVSSEEANACKAAKFILDALEASMSGSDAFKAYSEKFVPFVKSCKNDDTLWLPADTTDSKSLIGQLQEQLLRSQAIRKLYGMYCYAFDVFHVLVGAFVCSSDVEVLQNWVLDFVIRVCRGEYFWKRFESNLQIQHLLNVLRKEVTFKRHTDLYYLVKHIRNGEGIECMSANLMQYSELENVLSKTNSELMMQYHFPSVLFENQYDQLAFTVSLAVLKANVNRRTGQVEKGTFAKVRHLSNLLKSVTRELHEFDRRVNLPWIESTVELFLASNKHLNEQVAEVMKIFCPPPPQE